MRIAILGFSDLEQSESLPIYRYFKAQNADITAYYWGTPALPKDVAKVRIDKDQQISGLDSFDLVVRGPAIHPRQIKTTAKITSLTDIFVKNCPSKNIVGVTGTKGKGTTSTLITKLLEAQGKKVWLGGNIGKPLLDDLPNIKSDDWVVLEMSAGQLISFSGRIPTGVILMVVPEHLDWHTDFMEYLEAKANLFKNQSTNDVAIYFGGNETSAKIAASSKGKKVPYFQSPGAFVRDDGMIIAGDGKEIIPKNEVKLLGEHNLQNICAALTAVSEAARSLDNAKSVLHSFSGLEHRLELVRSLHGTKYYDDSFGTTPETAIVAMQAVKEPKIMIMGGSDKGADFTDMVQEVVDGNVKHVVLIGNTAEKIENLLRQNGFTSITMGLTQMKDVVKKAQYLAEPGDAVLLSTGCASFGLFQDYKDRGNQFKNQVQALV